ncbi:DUF86 domain-containing protein [Gloeocapsopsis crepidinum LEGE 06123]|uniref:DUF86 domain-containing protein n=1 Tax=Gloeocapsopsis crepidinum LEGE 06123 TaxID=588587 RepID=A0ABR9UY36_9CHRO|nr:HepT-like ribonuclease domain-containing protein [Gloeocapsopsis crepidinum]MBE9193234.1 DUF86 domain-containing protein [Gloeocapsopsis crepidinum LEGE 06123]
MPNDEASVLDIFKAGQRIIEFAQGLSRADLEIDVLRLSAILYQIQIVGEATKRLSIEFREQHSEIPWNRAAGMRDIIAHQYDRIDLDVVRTVVQRSIPELLVMIAPLLPEEPT